MNKKGAISMQQFYKLENETIININKIKYISFKVKQNFTEVGILHFNKEFSLEVPINDGLKISTILLRKDINFLSIEELKILKSDIEKNKTTDNDLIDIIKINKIIDHYKDINWFYILKYINNFWSNNNNNCGDVVINLLKDFELNGINVFNKILKKYFDMKIELEYNQSYDLEETKKEILKLINSFLDENLNEILYWISNNELITIYNEYKNDKSEEKAKMKKILQAEMDKRGL